MRDQLSSGQVDSYDEHGFLVIEGFLDAAELEPLRQAVDEAVPPDGGAPSDGAQRSLDREHDDLWRTDERVRRLCLDPRLGAVARRLGRIDEVRLARDRAVVRPAWCDASGWQMDTPGLWFTHPATSTFWFALTDTDLRGGCPYYVSGSHRARARTAGRMRLDGLRLLHPDWRDAEPVPCPVGAGALIARSGDTAHGACPNITPLPRAALAVTWMPAGSRFDGVPDALPAVALGAVQPGDRLDVDLFPALPGRR